MFINILLAIGAIASWIFCAFCGFKSRQTSGKDYWNEIRIDNGSGSFVESLLNPFKTFIWEIFAFLGLAIAIILSGMLLKNLFADDVTAFFTPAPESSATVPQTTKQDSKATAPTVGSQKLKADQNATGDQSASKSRGHDLNSSNTAATRLVESSDAVKKSASQFTAEEIRQMEIEKQYSGNDPIIRARLGLPPKVDE
jgi:hypothetical protein